MDDGTATIHKINYPISQLFTKRFDKIIMHLNISYRFVLQSFLEYYNYSYSWLSKNVYSGALWVRITQICFSFGRANAN